MQLVLKACLSLFFLLFLPVIFIFSSSAMSLHLSDQQELSQRQTMLMTQRWISINVFPSPSPRELYTTVNFALVFFSFLPSILGLRGMKESGFSTYQIVFYQTDCQAFSAMVDCSQDASFSQNKLAKVTEKQLVQIRLENIRVIRSWMHRSWATKADSLWSCI